MGNGCKVHLSLWRTQHIEFSENCVILSFPCGGAAGKLIIWFNWSPFKTIQCSVNSAKDVWSVPAGDVRLLFLSSSYMYLYTRRYILAGFLTLRIVNERKMSDNEVPLINATALTLCCLPMAFSDVLMTCQKMTKRWNSPLINVQWSQRLHLIIESPSFFTTD